MKQMSRWKGGPRHPFGILLFVVLALLSPFRLPPVSGLQCYECTSEDPGCDKVTSTPALKKDCGEDAIGCAVYVMYFDYVFGGIYHRSCIYSYDDGETMQGWLELDKDGYDSLNGRTFTYDDVILDWDASRKKIKPSAPAVIRAKHYPIGIEGRFYLKGYLEAEKGELSNGPSFKKWTWGWDSTFREEDPKRIYSVECYSCEFEIKGSRIYANHSVPDVEFTQGNLFTYNFPPCGSKDTSPLKKVTCKNAYGCATFLEMKNASKIMQEVNRGTNIDTVARVWRGCWYPGEQKCLRNPDSIVGHQLRSLKSGKGKQKERKETDMASEQCDGAYKRTIDGGGVVLWAGVKQIASSEEYNKYLECRHNVRVGLGEGSELKLVTDNVQSEYTWIQYLFCGPEAKCNKFVLLGKDLVGKDKYNPKDYEEFEDKKDPDPAEKKNVTKLDKCSTEEGSKEKNTAALISTDIMLQLFGFICLFTASVSSVF